MCSSDLSREGLSYIPETIEAIKVKLEQVNSQLAIHVAEEADKITNNWEKALFLQKKSSGYLWQAAVKKYIADTKFEYVNNTHHWSQTHTFKLNLKELKDTYNIELRGFQKSRNYNVCSNLKPHATYVNTMGTQVLFHTDRKSTRLNSSH